MFGYLQLKTFVLPRWGGLPKRKKTPKIVFQIFNVFKNWSG